MEDNAADDARIAFGKAIIHQLDLIGAAPVLTAFAAQQELEQMIAADLAADPRCVVALDVVRRIAVQTAYSWRELWAQRFRIVSLHEHGLDADAIVAHAIAELQRKVAQGYWRVEPWELFMPLAPSEEP